MDALIYWLVIGILAVIALMPADPRRYAPDLADVFSGLFRDGSDLGWPRGVQEEDSVPAWGAPSSAADPGSGTEMSGGSGSAAIEDTTGRVPVMRVHRGT